MSEKEEEAILYVYPEDAFSEGVVIDGLNGERLSTEIEIKEVKQKERGPVYRARVYQVTPRLIGKLYAYRSRDRKLKFEEFIEFGFAVRRFKLLSPESMKIAYGMKALPGFSRSELRRIVRKGEREFEVFIASLKEDTEDENG